MGKSLQVRGTVQVVDIRTLNAELSELTKEDIEEVDRRSTKELILSGGQTDVEVSFQPEIPAGTKARFIFLKSDNAVSVKFDSVLSAAVPTTFLMHKGEVSKLFLSGSGIGAKVKIIALA
jgi:hypothetical protein